MAKLISLESPFHVRLGLWFAERFTSVHAISAVVLFAMVTVYGHRTAQTHVGLQIVYLFGALSVIGQFLFLRILDEHKDFNSDIVNHPQRVLQRGLIQLSQLRMIGGAVIIFQILTNYYLDRGVGTCFESWVWMMAYSFLMFKEFYIPNWLKGHSIPYALSHMMIVPFIINWIFTMTSPGKAWSWGWVNLTGLVFVSGLAYEIVRKMRGEEEEKSTLESYSRQLGLPASIGLAAIVLVLTFLCFAVTIRNLSEGRNAMAVSVVLLLNCLYHFYRYGKKQTAKTRKANEAAVGLMILANYFMIILQSVII